MNNDEILHPQWKEYLKIWLKDNPQQFIEYLEDLEEGAEDDHKLASKFLAMDDYELHLRFRNDSENELEEAAYMRSLMEKQELV